MSNPPLSLFLLAPFFLHKIFAKTQNTKPDKVGISTADRDRRGVRTITAENSWMQYPWNDLSSRSLCQDSYWRLCKTFARIPYMSCEDLKPSTFPFFLLSLQQATSHTACVRESLREKHVYVVCVINSIHWRKWGCRRNNPSAPHCRWGTRGMGWLEGSAPRPVASSLEPEDWPSAWPVLHPRPHHSVTMLPSPRKLLEGTSSAKRRLPMCIFWV